MIFFMMGRTKNATVFLSALFLLAGCNSLSSYTDYSFSDYAAGGTSTQDGTWKKEREIIGYREQTLEPGVYVIEYVGKVGEPAAVTSHWALKRAAEFALTQGSDGFVVVGMEARDSRSSEETTYQWIGNYQYSYETTTHELPFTKLVVLTDEFYGQGSETSFLFSPNRVLSWYEAANQRHRDRNKMFDVRGTIERHFKYFTEENVPMMRSIVNSPPKDVYWWEAGIAEGRSRIYLAIDEYANTVTHIWVDKQHLARTFEDPRDILIDVAPGEHLLEIAVYTWFREPDDPRETIDGSMLVTTKEGELSWVRCPPKFGVARGSFVADGQAIQAELNDQYKWK
ncbi:MAG: hypothetical protein KJP17_01650 [Gammaproteobacteria bacterium]|nr:hypothetical protein [Gammaproteobacteria bacterium]